MKEESKSRSDADYAIEFGGYLAKDADQLRDAVNAYFKAKESENEARIAKAEETLSECMSAARAGAFEFRKRADRAIASRSEQRFTRAEVLAAIDAEPELPGDMPDAMWAQISTNREYATEAMQIAVRQTKREIKQRLGERSDSTGGKT